MHVDGLEACHKHLVGGSSCAAEHLVLHGAASHVHDDTSLGGALVASTKHIVVDEAVVQGHTRGQFVAAGAAFSVTHGAVFAAAIHIVDGAAVDGHLGVASDVGVGAAIS